VKWRVRINNKKREWEAQRQTKFSFYFLHLFLRTKSSSRLLKAMETDSMCLHRKKSVFSQLRYKNNPRPIRLPGGGREYLIIRSHRFLVLFSSVFDSLMTNFTCHMVTWKSWVSQWRTCKDGSKYISDCIFQILQSFLHVNLSIFFEHRKGKC
jgi:hypothetical protein